MDNEDWTGSMHEGDCGGRSKELDRERNEYGVVRVCDEWGSQMRSE